MNVKPETKAQLLKKIKAIEDKERADMLKKYYPKFKKMEGKCFKYKNTLSSPNKKSGYWNTYTKILKITPDDVYDTHASGIVSRFSGIRFEIVGVGSEKVITISNVTGYVPALGEEITEKEFIAAWDKAKEEISLLPI